MNEKRKKPRIKVELRGSLSLENKNILIDIVEIGAGGICFLSKTLLVYGEEATAYFRLDNKEIGIKGRICRINGNKCILKYDYDETVNINFINNFILNCYWGKDFKKMI